MPNPANPLPHADPALQGANFVNNAFRHMGSISSEVHGNSASVQSYLIATHAYGPNASRTGVSVVGGTYFDTDVRINGRWYIETRVLDITSSVQVPAGL